MPNRKSFLAHQGRERPDVLAAALQQSRLQGWSVGASIFLPRYKAATSLKHAQRFDTHATYVLADPETRKLLVPFPYRGRGRDDYPYLARDYAVNRQGFVDSVLEAQIAADRKTLISPSLIHGITGQQRELDLTIDFAKRAHKSSILGKRRLMFGIEASEHIFADDTARNDMLDKLVELPERPIYLRMTCAGPPSRRGYVNQEALVGLRAAVESLAENDRPTFLVQSGLAGWLMLPFGAAAFGAGISSTLQRCTGPDGAGGGGGTPPLPWYFAPPILGFVLASELNILREFDSWTDCTCPFCVASPPNPRDFDAEAAGQHFLWWCAALANEANLDRPLDRIRTRLRAARSLWQAVQRSGAQLDPRSMPTHLEVWSAVVA